MAARKLSIREMMEEAGMLESEGRITEAIKAYTSVIRHAPLFAAAYNRLMVIYRREKRSKEELQVIRQAITAHEKEIRETHKDWQKANRSSATISRRLAQSLGLLDDKGLPLYERPQLIKWRKRLELLRNKMKGPRGSRAKTSAAKRKR